MMAPAKQQSYNSSMSRELLPDSTLLSAIFPTVASSSSITTTVLANAWETCTFKASFGITSPPGLPQDIVVRMETSSGLIEQIAEVHKAARQRLPDLIPETLVVGKAVTGNGRTVEYMVQEFVKDTVSSEDVWANLFTVQKEELVDQVVSAMKHFQSVNVTSTIHLPAACTSNTGSENSIRIGGPKYGYHTDMRAFLKHLVAKHQMKTTPTSSLYETAEGVCIVSARPELSSLFLSNKELEDLQNTIVLSHNDLELRNILVRNNSKSEKTTSTSYELAAITDWEFAGFFPRAFETAVKDSELGIGNLYYDWYKMVRTATASVDNASQKLIDAVQIIVDSRRLKWKRNVGTEVRMRWLLREGLEMRTEFGWVRKEGVEERGFSKKENEELEMDVLRDWGMI
jgi:hypothetical protein